MPRARKHLVCLSRTPYYHVTSRCVRRAFLCGHDQVSGKSYEHRRSWIEERVRILSSLFSIELCAYAIMSNHYHLVVRLNPDESDGWSDNEVLKRWMALFRGPLLVQRYRDGESLNNVETDTLRDIAAVYRKRLGSLSWFMKCLNEPIARQANAEDGCTGHFWEARFHSQPLCTEAALIAALVYVDLNPVRAGIALKPELSDYTSIKARVRPIDHESLIMSAAEHMPAATAIRPAVLRALMPFADDARDLRQDALPIKKREYLKLVDQTGRLAVHGKRGRIDASLAPILERLGLAPEDWLRCSTAFRENYCNGDLRVRKSA